MIIKPVSELRNNYLQIEAIAIESNEPIFLTKNGEGSTVLMSMDTYRDLEQKIKLLQEQIEELNSIEEVYGNLLEAEVQARETSKRYSLEDLRKSTEGIKNEQKLQNRISSSL